MNRHDRLCDALAKSDWNNVVDVLKPKDFPRDETGQLIDKRVLSKIAEILTDRQDSTVPTNVQIVLLKCLVNSCVEGYKQEKNNSDDQYSHEFYKTLSKGTDSNADDPAFFPYNGISYWAVEYVEKYTTDASSKLLFTKDNTSECSNNDFEMLRLLVQFLCNLVTFACNSNNLPYCLNTTDFKTAIITLAGCKKVPLARAACAYVHNALKKLPESYFLELELKNLAESLLSADELGIHSARETLMILLKRPNWLRSIYDDLPMKSKLYLFEIIHSDIRDSVYSGDESTDNATNFTTELIQFMSERFRKRSDLILKTVDSYLDGMEPAEITLLLDIIGVISSKDSIECRLLKNDKSLMINCIFLLKSLHMVGKESDNFFTPLQKLSDFAASTRLTDNSDTENNIQSHPAFGFKAGLIRAIGNLCHKHKENQDLLRETSAIPLLLDCCNIDARNPLLMQWTIFALRNVCEKNLENQEIIRNCAKVGEVDSLVLQEMGFTLHEGDDGKAIGILPLPTNK